MNEPGPKGWAKHEASIVSHELRVVGEAEPCCPSEWTVWDWMDDEGDLPVRPCSSDTCKRCKQRRVFSCTS